MQFASAHVHLTSPRHWSRSMTRGWEMPEHVLFV